MAANNTVLWIDTDRRCLVRSPQDPTKISLNESLVNGGTTRPFKLVFLERDSSGNFVNVTLTGIQLLVKAARTKHCGTFKLSYGGTTSRAIDAGASAPQLESVLNSVSTVSALGGVDVVKDTQNSWLVQTRASSIVGGVGELEVAEASLMTPASVKTAITNSGLTTKGSWNVQLTNAAIVLQETWNAGTLVFGGVTYNTHDASVNFNTALVQQVLGGGHTAACVMQILGSLSGLLLDEEFELQSPAANLGAPLGMPVWGGIPMGGLVWVDQLLGNDSSGARGRLDKPYKTLAAAKAAAINGDTIVVLHGTFNEGALWKNGVTWLFYPGTSVVYNANNATSIFADLGEASGFCNVRGWGQFIRTVGAASVVHLTGEGSVFDIEAASVAAYNGACIRCSFFGATVNLRIKGDIQGNPDIWIDDPDALVRLYQGNALNSSTLAGNFENFAPRRIGLPSSPTDALGLPGDYYDDQNYFYRKLYGSTHRWRRVPHSTW